MNEYVGQHRAPEPDAPLDLDQLLEWRRQHGKDQTAWREQFGRFVRLQRQAFGWTQADLAAELRVSRSTVSALEHAKYWPSWVDLNRLQRIFDQVTGTHRRS